MRALRFLDPGASTTVQDAGRAGLAHLGVPRSGWLDPVSATLANRLVGNPEDAAVLECLLGGLSFVAEAALAVAVTGGNAAVRVQGRPAPHSAAVAVPSGAVVEVGPVTAGLRVYVAVAGGCQVEPVLGSRSTDTLSGLGPPAVTSATVLPVGPACGPPSAAEAPTRSMGPAVLRCTPGPRADWFDESALRRLAGTAYLVQPDSNRVALRLQGEPLRRRRDPAGQVVGPPELPSEGLVLGSVQVPSSGQPLVFLNDHPTTGGYPVVAVVDARDLPLCAHLRPGDEVRFRQEGPWPTG